MTTIPERHQIKIAKDTLRMSDAGAMIMGGMTKEKARKILGKQKEGKGICLWTGDYEPDLT